MSTPIDLQINFSAPSDKAKLFQVLKGLDGAYNIRIERPDAGRSAASNRYLWGVVYRYVASEIGLTKEEAHSLLGEMFLSYERALPNGEVKRFVRSTAKLKQSEMAEYIEKIKSFALEFLGTIIPEPGQVIE